MKELLDRLTSDNEYRDPDGTLQLGCLKHQPKTKRLIQRVNRALNEITHGDDGLRFFLVEKIFGPQSTYFGGEQTTYGLTVAQAQALISVAYTVDWEIEPEFMLYMHEEAMSYEQEI